MCVSQNAQIGKKEEQLVKGTWKEGVVIQFHFEKKK